LDREFDEGIAGNVIDLTAAFGFGIDRIQKSPNRAN
jgi:hypothetical protein